jgi:hypothetical protein
MNTSDGDQVNKWWWLDWPSWRWSRQEQAAVSQLGLTAAVVFLLLMIPQFALLPKSWNTPIVALITVLPTALLSCLASRFICGELWPDLMRAGDEKAAERLAIQEGDD